MFEVTLMTRFEIQKDRTMGRGLWGFTIKKKHF